MADHLRLSLDAQDLKAVLDALNIRRKDVERYMRKNERNGFKVAAGKVDVNVVNLAALTRAIQNITTQIRSEETRK